MVRDKLNKAIESINNALDNVEKGNKRMAIGDLDFVKENAQEAIYILLAELDVDKDKK